MTLYLKYRPQTLDELDSTSVKDQLKSIITSGKIPHAFLFSGPKGTGKTSAARILAKILNCETLGLKKEELGFNPCNVCGQCKSISNGSNMDVIEMDAASNRGIDDIRSLREGIKLAPAKAKMKVYIIDEAHMLTTEASNAFLKTLEEPPEHVVFILATTNPEKLISTVKSRLANVYFHKATLTETISQLEKVVKGEKVKVDDGVLQAIAKSADGSFRDSIKILESLIFKSKILKKDEVEEFLFHNKEYNIENFIGLLAQKDSKRCLSQIEELENSGEVIKNFVENLISRIRLAILNKEGLSDLNGLSAFNENDLMDLLDIILTTKLNFNYSPIPQLALEIAVIKWCSKTNDELRKMNYVGEPKQEVKEKDTKTINNVKKLEKMSEETWKKILIGIKEKNASLEALLRSAKPIGFDGKKLELAVFYKFHKERLETSQYRRMFEDCVGDIVGSQVYAIFNLTVPPKTVLQEVKQETRLTDINDTDIIKAAKEIFSDV